MEKYGLENKCIISLEEPEAHIFPYSFTPLIEYIEKLHKKAYIVISTHNGYFVSNIWDKIQELKIYYVYRDKYGSTKLAELDFDKISKELITGPELLALKPSNVIPRLTKKSTITIER